MSTDPGDGPLDLRLLGEIVEGTATETGEAFFDALVRHLARALPTKGAWVTELLAEERRLRALSFWLGDGYYGEYEYDITNTPCEPVVRERNLFHVPDRLIELFPGDPDLPELGAVSYMGVPLLDLDGEMLGHLAVLHDHPLPEDPRAVAIFRIFAGRAAAELRRLRRERALRENEQRLSLLVSSAMDAIVELDAHLVVDGMNPAALEAFACDARGRSFRDLLGAEARGKLTYLMQQLGTRPGTRPTLWIPGGIEARRLDGTPFQAEATISRFELDGRVRYTFILRNVDERRAAEEKIRALLDETASLRAELDALQGFDEILGRSPALRRTLDDIDRVAPEDTTVLITGETGTGKELVARAIHARSPRSTGPLVAVNCAAIPPTLQESELFGHERGAFTGATQRREGRFRAAHGGTLFLDEVGELPLELQAKLLRVLQEGEIEPVGGSRPVAVDVRVVAATNRDLLRMVAAGTFRQDLYYRLSVFPLHLPALREREDDVILLAEAFARRFAERRGRAVPSLTAADQQLLMDYEWPGNVRELQNVIERAFLTSSDGQTLDLHRALRGAGPRSVAARASILESGPGIGTTSAGTVNGRLLTDAELRELERANILRALDLTRGKISGSGGAAELLGINPNTLTSRLKALGIRRRR